jgi:hypothetical protein
MESRLFQTCPSKAFVDHAEITRVVLSCMCPWVEFY